MACGRTVIGEIIRTKKSLNVPPATGKQRLSLLIPLQRTGFRSTRKLSREGVFWLRRLRGPGHLNPLLDHPHLVCLPTMKIMGVVDEP